jgi:hypothetical protein
MDKIILCLKNNLSLKLGFHNAIFAKTCLFVLFICVILTISLCLLLLDKTCNATLKAEGLKWCISNMNEPVSNLIEFNVYSIGNVNLISIEYVRFLLNVNVCV